MPLPSVSPAAAEPEGPQPQARREEAFHMDSAYSEQAALLQRSRPPLGDTCAWSKGSLPVRRLAARPPANHYSLLLKEFAPIHAITSNPKCKYFHSLK